MNPIQCGRGRREAVGWVWWAPPASQPVAPKCWLAVGCVCLEPGTAGHTVRVRSRFGSARTPWCTRAGPLSIPNMAHSMLQRQASAAATSRMQAAAFCAPAPARAAPAAAAAAASSPSASRIPALPTTTTTGLCSPRPFGLRAPSLCARAASTLAAPATATGLAIDLRGEGGRGGACCRAIGAAQRSRPRRRTLLPACHASPPSQARRCSSRAWRTTRCVGGRGQASSVARSSSPINRAPFFSPTHRALAGLRVGHRKGAGRGGRGHLAGRLGAASSDNAWGMQAAARRTVSF